MPLCLPRNIEYSIRDSNEWIVWVDSSYLESWLVSPAAKFLDSSAKRFSRASLR
jgi:hypothetical protein